MIQPFYRNAAGIKKLACPSNPHQGRAEDAGGIAHLIFHNRRLQFVGKNIFPTWATPSV